MGRWIDSIEALEALYDAAPLPQALAKVTDHITDHYRRLIEASPFVALATVGPEGLDCSPRGEGPGFVRVADPKTLVLPDRRGNNRIDSLRNIVRDPRVALLFLIPGSGTTFRVNGSARISADPELLESLAAQGQTPRSALVITVAEAYFQCAKAIVRSRLWAGETQVDPASLPSAGDMIATLTDNAYGGTAYDAEWPERARRTLW